MKILFWIVLACNILWGSFMGYCAVSTASISYAVFAALTLGTAVFMLCNIPE